jgi:hypothetical protein
VVFRRIPGTDKVYGLLSFGADGTERADDPQDEGEPFFNHLLGRLREEQTTDIFLISHGWKGDFPAAVAQYDSWFAALEKEEVDQETMAIVFGNFHPCRIALHWPSVPCGDEEIPRQGESFQPTTSRASKQWVDLYAHRLGEGRGESFDLGGIVGPPAVAVVLDDEKARSHCGREWNVRLCPLTPKQVGTFGTQGSEFEVIDRPIDTEYDFQEGQVYNLEVSQFICHANGPSGSHNDIAAREIAHVIWQAAATSPRPHQTGTGT